MASLFARSREATIAARQFTRFACIDWSGAKGERQRGIALATCAAGIAAPVLLKPADHDAWSRAAVQAWLLAQADMAADIVVGIDASLSLPFAATGAFFPGLVGSPADARALWALIDTCAARDPHLGIDGFVDDSAFSPYFRRHGGREGAAFGGGRGRLRVTEARAESAGAASPFNLVGAGQVGRASLAAMRVLHRLNGRVPVWPFDPVPAAGPLVVEIYTRIAAVAGGRPRGRGKIRDAATLDAALARLGSEPHAPCVLDEHRADALVGAAWLRRAASEQVLWTPDGVDRVRHTEGWTFGVA